MIEEREELGGGASDGPPEPHSPPVTRRAALRVLGVVPFAGSAVLAQPPTPPPRQPHVTPNQPASQGQGAAGAGSRAARKFFTAREYRTARVLADDVIPRDERSGSASEVGVLEFMDFHLSVEDTSNETRTAFRGGLRWVDTESRRRFGVAYDKAAAAQRHQLLDDIAWPAKARPEMSAGVAFFSRFRDMVASGFFSSAAGWRDLRYTGNVFAPQWDGCPAPALAKLGVSADLMTSRVAPR